MSREEAIEVLQQDIPCEHDTDLIEALEMAIKALEQEPCEDEYIQVPKKALKYRTAGMVAYNAEWLKNHFDIERAVICGVQEPQQVRTQMSSADCISRQGLLDDFGFSEKTRKWGGDHSGYNTMMLYEIQNMIESAPSVKPQERTGHWILLDECSNSGYYCSECHKKVVKEGWSNTVKKIKYCPNCGAKMSENPTGSKNVQKQDAEIKVGDEVITKIGNKGVVIMDVPCEDGSICVWFPTCNRIQMYPVKDLSKTGRHFDQITEVLDKMRGEE